jgi:regulator of sigma E protease
MGIISVNLGILNLFPVPVLDGGHILFILLEMILGRPLSMRKLEIAQQVGLFILISLMIFVFYNDLTRIFTE